MRRPGATTKEDLAQFGGELGRHVEDVIGTVNWADNFRAGDTPTVLCMIDPNHDLDNPTQASWAGRCVRPFPQEHRNFRTGADGGCRWDCADPARIWHNASAAYQTRVHTLLQQRPRMYAALLKKVKDLDSVGATVAKKDTENSTGPLPRFDTDQGIILEAEEAEYTSDIATAYDGGAGNGDYLNMEDGGSLVRRFDHAVKPGAFPVPIRYRLPFASKKQVLFVNSANLGEIEFSGP